jgi:galactose mutarotase-like enzyme
MNGATPQWITIRNDDLAAQINPRGAELSELRGRGGEELLWNGNPQFWTGRSPLLFPIVGALNGGMFRFGGHRFALPRHGFARTTLFSVLTAGPSSVTLRLSADATTLAVYPFEFDLDVTYQLTAATLSMTATIHNRGRSDMFASFGYHPAFSWPLRPGQPRESYWLRFEADEPAGIRRLDGNGLLRPDRFPTPIERATLMLNDALFRDDVVILDQFKSRSLLYGGDSGPRLRLAFPDARFLGIWTKPGAPFICIEPWQGIADPDGYAGDLPQKPGITALAAGASLASTLCVAVEP